MSFLCPFCKSQLKYIDTDPAKLDHCYICRNCNHGLIIIIDICDTIKCTSFEIDAPGGFFICVMNYCDDTLSIIGGGDRESILNPILDTKLPPNLTPKKLEEKLPLYVTFS